MDKEQKEEFIQREKDAENFDDLNYLASDLCYEEEFDWAKKIVDQAIKKINKDIYSTDIASLVSVVIEHFKDKKLANSIIEKYFNSIKNNTKDEDYGESILNLAEIYTFEEDRGGINDPQKALPLLNGLEKIFTDNFFYLERLGDILSDINSDKKQNDRLHKINCQLLDLASDLDECSKVLGNFAKDTENYKGSWNLNDQDKAQEALKKAEGFADTKKLKDELKNTKECLSINI